MATTLVEPSPFLHHVPRNLQQPPHPTISFPVAPSPLELSAAQLAPLASQHHTSDYNRQKFGIQGCPVPYLPLSVQLPDYFDELQRRQVRCSQGKSWWPCRVSGAQSVVLSSAGAQPQEIIHLQEEIQAAIAEPLSNILQGPHTSGAKQSLHPSIKTSSTHPINISSIVPPELLPIISSNISPTSSPASYPPPIVFEIPKLFALDRLTLPSTRRCDLWDPRAASPYPPHSFVVGHFRARSNVRDALRTALNGGISGIDSNSERGKLKHDTFPGVPFSTHLHRSTSTCSPYTQARLSTLHPDTSSISLSLSLTLAEAPPASPSNPPPNNPKIPENATHSPPTPNPRLDIRPCQQVPRNLVDTFNDSSSSLAINQGLDDRRSILRPSSPPHITTPQSAPNTPLTIGNLFLSSCPGKKVRLQGPVKGRSGVCRDLDTDLKRMKELGVGCIICCLDDQELEFLGAPWPEYEECARINNIDILRIPMPEGLAPLTPASLNTHLTQLIDTYTARGIPILVHCRGGVGRAGVIACCWIIKLGLCGWYENEADFSLTSLSAPSVPTSNPSTGSKTPSFGEVYGHGKVAASRHNIVHFVERVIAVVRKRRSMKAVETYEQVKFLVDFVEYLKEGAMA